MKGSAKATLGVGALVLVMALAGVGLWAGSTPPPQRLYGEVELREIRVAAKVGGRVAALHVAEGERVEAGAPLFELDGPEVRARLAQAEAARDAAEAQRDRAVAGSRDEELDMARRDWQRAQAQVELAESSYRRLAALHDEGLIAGQAYDEARAQWRDASERAAAAEAQYRLARSGARDEELRASEAQARQAAAAVAEAEALLAETRIAAPLAGEVAQIVMRRGELAPAGVPVLTLVDPADSWVVFNVREDHLRGLQPGSTVSGYVPALQRELELRVSRLQPLPEFATWKQAAGTPGYDLRSFQVEAVPTVPQPTLRAGMTVILERP